MISRRRQSQACKLCMQESCAFAVLNGGVHTSTEALEAALRGTQPSSSDSAVHDFDIVHPGFQASVGAPALTAVLYGAIGSPAFYAMHQLLRARALAGPSKGRALVLLHPSFLLMYAKASNLHLESQHSGVRLQENLK